MIYCGADSIITPTITEVSHEYFTNSSSSSYSFPLFECSLPVCCQQMVYTISSTENMEYPTRIDYGFMSSPELVDGLMVSQVDTSKPLILYFWVIADN